MNKAKKDAWRKHRQKRKKLKERQKTENAPANQSEG